MTVAPMIAMKSTKAKSLEAIGRELDRRAHVYRNDIDPTRTYLNINYCVRPEDATPMPLEEAIKRRMGELVTKRKIRDNQVRAVGIIVSTNGMFDTVKPDGEIEHDDAAAHTFLGETLDWFKNELGPENLLAAAEHYDEGTAHIQMWFAPVIHDADGYDRLCAKELFSPDRYRKLPDGTNEFLGYGRMSNLQTCFWGEVTQKYGFEPPMPKALRQKGYRSLEAYKQAEGFTREVKAKMAAMQSQCDEMAERMAEAKVEAAKYDQIKEAAKAEAEAEAQRLESVRQGRIEAEKRVSGLREQLAAAGETAEEQPAPVAGQSICRDAQALVEGRGEAEVERDLDRDIEGLRSRISSLGSRIEGLRRDIEIAKHTIADRLREGIRVDMQARLGETLADLMDKLRINGVIAATARGCTVRTGRYMAEEVKPQRQTSEPPRLNRKRSQSHGLRR